MNRHELADLFPDTSEYTDLIDQPAPKVPGHYPMSNNDRAMQFAPFAALTGYHELIQKTNQRFERKTYLTGAQLRRLQSQILLLADKLPLQVQIEAFNPSSGYYETNTDTLTAIQQQGQQLVLDQLGNVSIYNLRKITPK